MNLFSNSISLLFIIHFFSYLVTFVIGHATYVPLLNLKFSSDRFIISKDGAKVLTSDKTGDCGVCGGLGSSFCDEIELLTTNFVGATNTECNPKNFNPDGKNGCTGTYALGFAGEVKLSNGKCAIGICAAGNVCEAGVRQKPCSPGFACPATEKFGSYFLVKPITCKVGTFSQVGAATCTNCSAGTFSGAQAGSCTNCKAGTFSGIMASTCTKCKAGTFSGDRSGSCSICRAGTFSGEQAGSCTPCRAGTYSPKEGASTCIPCDAGNFCPTEGLISPIECPFGTFCPTGSSKPSFTTTAILSDQDRFAFSSVACSGSDCLRFVIPKKVITKKSLAEAIFEAVITSGGTSTGKINNLENNSKLTDDGQLLTISGGNQIIIECKQNDYQSFVFLGSGSILTLDIPENINFYNKIIIRHCIFNGKIVMKSRSVIVLDDSSIAIQNIDFSSATSNDPVFIVLGDSSHIAGLVPPIDSKLTIIQPESTPNSIIGCDQMPSCDQALFVNNNRAFPLNSIEALNLINPLVPNTTEINIPANAKAITISQKRSALQSLVTCGLFGSNIHLPSTYLGRAIFCAQKSATDKIEFIDIVKSVASRSLLIALGSKIPDSILIKAVVDATSAQIELSNSGELFMKTEVVIAPPVTAEFLFRDQQLSFGMPKLISALDRVTISINGLTNDIQKRIQDILFQTGFTVAIGSVNQNELNSFLTLFQNMKQDAQISKNNVDFALQLAKEEKDICFTKFKNVLNSKDEHSKEIDRLLTELPPIIERVIKDLQKKAFFTALLQTLKFGLDVGVALSSGGASELRRSLAPLSDEDDEDGENNPFETASTGIDLIESGVGVYVAWNDFAEIKKARSDSTELNAAIKTVDRIATSLINAITSLDNFVSGASKNLDALTMPITDAILLEDQLVSALDPLGCSFRNEDAELNKGCKDTESEIHAISLLLVEGLQSLTKIFEVVLKIELLGFESDQFQIAINSWNDTIQNSIGDIAKKIETTAKQQADLNQRLKFILDLTHSALSRAQVHSLVMINNAMNGLRTICRAAAYQFPNYLDDEEPAFTTACKTKIDLSLEAVQSTLETFSLFMENKWVQDTGTKTAVQVLVDVTNLIDIPKFWSQNVKLAEFLITPETFKDKITGDNSLNCIENADLLFANVFLVNQDDTLKRPSNLSGKFTSFVTVRGPNERIFKGKTHFYDLDAKSAQPRFRFRTDISSFDSFLTIFKPENVFFNREVFASTTPFGTYQIVLQNYPIDLKARFFLQLRVLSNRDVPDCFSNTATNSLRLRQLSLETNQLFNMEKSYCSLLNNNEMQCMISNECAWNSQSNSCFNHNNNNRNLQIQNAVTKCSSLKTSKTCAKNKLCAWDLVTNSCIDKPATLPPSRMKPPEKVSLRLKASNGQWVQAKSNGIIDCNGGTGSEPPANTTFIFSFRFQQNLRNIYYIKSGGNWAEGRYAWMRIKEDGKNHLVISKKNEIEFTQPLYMNEIEAYPDGKISISTNEYKYLSCKSDKSIVADVDQVDKKFKQINPGKNELFQVVLA